MVDSDDSSLEDIQRNLTDELADKCPSEGLYIANNRAIAFLVVLQYGLSDNEGKPLIDPSAQPWAGHAGNEETRV